MGRVDDPVRLNDGSPKRVSFRSDSGSKNGIQCVSDALNEMPKSVGTGSIWNKKYSFRHSDANTLSSDKVLKIMSKK